VNQALSAYENILFVVVIGTIRESISLRPTGLLSAQ
jgi:hypothetical protein